jgi:putative heme iron utilization protein
MIDKPSVLREADDEARTLARVLLRSAKHAALAVIDPDTGFPSASRALIGSDIDGVPVILVSALSAHTKALTKDARASLLAGEPGKGDPLAYPRLGVQCLVQKIERATPLHERIRTRFLGRHPKAALYVDFPDFCFFRLRPRFASLNGGFGRAYLLTGDDLEIHSPANETIANLSEAILSDLNGRRGEIEAKIAGRFKKALKQDWRIFSVDAAGFDLASGDRLLRYEFDLQLEQLVTADLYGCKITSLVP